MRPLVAEIFTEQVPGDQRSAVRRTLRLRVPASTLGDSAMTRILDISERGVLIESPLDLAIGEMLRVDIPETSAATARVVWIEGRLAGCEFVDALTTGSISAAQLMSSFADRNLVDVSEAMSNDTRRVDAQADDESFTQTAIVIVTALIAAVALIIFLAAVSPR